MQDLHRRIWLPLLLVSLCTLSVYGVVTVADQSTEHSEGPQSPLWGQDAQCTLDHDHSSQTGYAFLDFFTAEGGYVARTHCMTTQAGETDWSWVWFLVILNLLVIFGYLKIFVFWRKAYLQEEPLDRNTKLMDLAWIFLFCAICGYVSSVVLFVWPAYRLLGLMLMPLAYFTWKFAANLDEFKLSLSAKRLARELNESLKREKKELERQVEIATSDLIHAKEEAEQANKAKTDFLARMSHEIRTPLTAIIGYSDIAVDDSTDEEGRTRSINTVSQNSKHLLNIINDVLDVAQIDSGDIKYEQIPCSISDIVTEVVEMMKLKAQRKDLAMELAISRDVPDLVVTDPTRLKQLVTNLVGNAIKFTEEGEISIAVEAREILIRETQCPPDESCLFELSIAVEDTGVGIEESKLTSIFESFTQESASTKRLYGGTGLGLTISRQIARDLNGDLTVESTPGVGSRFTCTLQAVRAGALEHKESLIRTESSGASQLASCRFLLIEDGEDNRNLIQYHFKKQGLNLDAVSDGIFGIQAINDAIESGESYEMIFMDISMPRMDGIECTRKLRSAGITTPIVMLSAHTLQEERERSYIVGATAYLSKPIDFTKLFELCASILDEDQINRQPAA